MSLSLRFTADSTPTRFRHLSTTYRHANHSQISSDLDNAEAALKNLRKQRERKEREIEVRLGEVVSSLHEDPQAQKELGDLMKRFGIAEADTSLCVRSRPNTCEAN